jgi:hypothetical protein
VNGSLWQGSILCKNVSVIKQYVGVQPFKNVAEIDIIVVRVSPKINGGCKKHADGFSVYHRMWLSLLDCALWHLHDDGIFSSSVQWGADKSLARPTSWYTYVPTYICTEVYVYIHMHVCTYSCMCVRTCVRAHTQTQIDQLHKLLYWMWNSSWKELNCNMKSSQINKLQITYN